MKETTSKCITEIGLDSQGETSLVVKNHDLTNKENKCVHCGLVLSNEWIKKNINNKTILVLK